MRETPGTQAVLDARTSSEAGGAASSPRPDTPAARGAARNALRGKANGLFDLQVTPTKVRRWASEADFFDRVAEKIGVGLKPLDPRTVARYQNPRLPLTNKQFRFSLLGDLRGKRVLDVGCGEGSNAMLLAKLGARVTGVDISSRSIELCQRRAILERVEDSTRFICAPMEAVRLPAASFDIVWGDGVLHHLIPELDGVLKSLLAWARPGAFFVFSEPVSLSPLLRRLRQNIPIHTDATPDERPLAANEVARIREALPGLRMQWFDAFGRLSRFALGGHHLECASLPRRLAANSLFALDRALLSVPALQPLGGMCVMYGHAPA